MRRPAQQLAILEGARLALVAVADGIFHIAGQAADGGPFVAGWETAAPHAAEIGRLHLAERPLDRVLDLGRRSSRFWALPGLPISDEPLDAGVARLAVVGIDLPTERPASRRLSRQGLARG